MHAETLIDIIAPIHDRNNCSDINSINGLYLNQYNKYSFICKRCALLDISKFKIGKEQLDEKDFNFFL